MEYFCWFTARSPALLLVFRQEAPSAAPPAAEEAQRRPRGGPEEEGCSMWGGAGPQPVPAVSAS